VFQGAGLRALCCGVPCLTLQDFITRLLERKPAKRLGMLAGKAADVKHHKWFDGFDWAGLETRRFAPPRQPKVGGGLCCLLCRTRLGCPAAVSQQQEPGRCCLPGCNLYSEFP
jgi:hypothetical protein